MTRKAMRANIGSPDAEFVSAYLRRARNSRKLLSGLSDPLIHPGQEHTWFT
jgi:hypothetical protein